MVCRYRRIQEETAGGSPPGWALAGPLPGEELRAQARPSAAAIPGMATRELGPLVNLHSTQIANKV